MAHLLTRLLLLALLPAVLASVAVGWMAYEWANAKLMRRASEQALAMSSHTTAWVRGTQVALEGLVHRLPAAGESGDAFDAATAAVLREFGLDAVVQVTGAGAAIVHRARVPAAAVQPLPEVLREMAQLRTARTSGVLTDPFGDGHAIVIGVPVIRRSAQETGAVLALINLVHLPRLADRLDLQPPWMALAIDRDGTVISTTTGPGPGPGEPHVHAHGLRPESGDVAFDIDSDGWMESYWTSPSTGWTFLVRTPRSAMLELVWRPVFAVSLVMALVFALAAAGTLRLQRRVADTVQRLRDAALALPVRAAAPTHLAFREADELASAMASSGRAVREATWRLRRSEERLSAILHTARSAIIVTDDQHRVQLFNAAAQDMFRCLPGEIMGRSIERLFTPPGWASYLAEAARVASNGALGPVTTTPVRCQRQHDGVFPAEFSVASGTDAPGARFYTLTLHDVTERERYQASLIAARDEVERLGLRFEHLLLQEMDRRQAEIAAELHDAVGSAVVGVAMLLEAARAQMADPPRARALLDRALQQVGTVAERVRQLARGIMPAGSDAGALQQALEQYCIDASELLGVRCSLRARGHFDDITPVEAGHVYRIVQEAITNAVRHGQATEVRISLARANGCCGLRVRDDGIGCDPQGAMTAQIGIGLRSMRARAHALGGVLGLHCPSSGGCEVRLRWDCRDGGVPEDMPAAAIAADLSTSGGRA